MGLFDKLFGDPQRYEDYVASLDGITVNPNVESPEPVAMDSKIVDRLIQSGAAVVGLVKPALPGEDN